jgi:hypothetical protein
MWTTPLLSFSFAFRSDQFGFIQTNIFLFFEVPEKRMYGKRVVAMLGIKMLTERIQNCHVDLQSFASRF